MRYIYLIICRHKVVLRSQGGRDASGARASFLLAKETMRILETTLSDFIVNAKNV